MLYMLFSLTLYAFSQLLDHVFADFAQHIWTKTFTQHIASHWFLTLRIIIFGLLCIILDPDIFAHIIGKPHEHWKCSRRVFSHLAQIHESVLISMLEF